jgi:transcriptional regulator with XRE-family HTH domain
MKAKMKKENLHSRVPITNEILEALKAKREKMHYSYNDVAELLGVHWSTYRKWELQETTHYSGLMEQRIKSYLNGDLPVHDNVADMAALEKLINRQKSLFRLLVDDYKLQMKFFSDMEKLLDKTLDKYSSIHQSKQKKK